MLHRVSAVERLVNLDPPRRPRFTLRPGVRRPRPPGWADRRSPKVPREMRRPRGEVANARILRGPWSSTSPTAVWPSYTIMGLGFSAPFLRRFLMHYGIYRRYPWGCCPPCAMHGASLFSARMVKREVPILVPWSQLGPLPARWRKMKPKPAVALCKSGQPHRHQRGGCRSANFLVCQHFLACSGSFEQFVGRNDRMPLPSAVLRKVQMDI